MYKKGVEETKIIEKSFDAMHKNLYDIKEAVLNLKDPVAMHFVYELEMKTLKRMKKLRRYLGMEHNQC